MYDFTVKINLLNLYIKILSSEETIISLFKGKILSIPSSQIVDISTNINIIINITKDSIQIDSATLSFFWKGQLSSSDGFVFINAFFYRLFYEHGFICLHANALITKNNTIVLIAGDFGAGKTTLCHFSQNNGYKICAGDQSVIKVKDNRLYFVSGSIFDKFNGSLNFLDYDECNTVRPISLITILNGMSDNGNLSITILTNVNLISKRISNYLFWPYYTPCLSIEDNSFIKLYPSNMNGYNEFWMNINSLRLYRGDKRRIFEDIKND